MGFTQSLRTALARQVYKAKMGDVFANRLLLDGSNTWADEKRRSWKLERLQNMIQFCWDHVPFYQTFWSDHGVSRDLPGALEELEKYPIFTKDLLREHRKDCTPDNLRQIPHIKKCTSGSTGNPVHYLLDHQNWAFTQAFHQWGWGQAGYIFGDPIVAIGGGALIPDRISLAGRLRNLLENRSFRFGVYVDDQNAREWVKMLADKKIEYLYSYPSVIYMLAQKVLELKLSAPQTFKAFVLTSEAVLPEYRRKIEQAFQRPVFEHAGSNDGGYMAYECLRHNGMHYNDLCTLIEMNLIKDGAGELLVTNLWNRATPFIRYENNDRVRLADAPCPCGCKFPLIASLEGRTSDILKFSNGRNLYFPPISQIIGEYDVGGWQAVQTAPDTLEIRIQSSGLSKDIEKEIVRVLSYHLGEGVKLRIKYAKELKRTKSGKLKPIWSEVVPDK